MSHTKGEFSARIISQSQGYSEIGHPVTSLSIGGLIQRRGGDFISGGDFMSGGEEIS